MVQVGKRIVFDKETGDIIHIMGEMQGDILPRESFGEIGYIDLEYGQDTDKFNRVKKCHVDVNSKQVIFDELYDPVITKDEQIEQLQQQVLQLQGVL